MKKMIAFDQDDTINITKLPVDAEMAELLVRLLDKYKVCIISGTNWEVMRKNDISPLEKLNRQVKWENYFIMPTTGTQFWHYEKEWKREYAHFLTEEQILKISDSLEKAARKLGYWCEKPAGEVIENRGSQVTFSALGQWASPEDKHDWDPDMKKRKEIVTLIEPNLAEIGVKIGIGGATSIDITLPGIDKAYGMRQLMEQTGVAQDEILFLGDMLQVGGNDFPVKAMGIDTIQVRSCEDTKWVLRGILEIQ